MKWNNIKVYLINKRVLVTAFTGNLQDAIPNDDVTLLSDSEKHYVLGITNELNRTRFISGRLFLRRTVGYMLDTKYYTGDFFIDKFGKPYLPPPYSWLYFNVSHTHHLISVAFTQGEPIGIDIELRGRQIPQNLMSYVFSTEEIKSILEVTDWQSAFLLGWVCKEAVLKCIGCGFLLDPKQIRIRYEEGKIINWKAYHLSNYNKLNMVYHLIPMTQIQNSIGVIAIQDNV
ncbi:4'-phosphopantetheinyl transferase family protein [Xenorhabdus bovienii]|uniref:4'-phosphopantetheinyl transferase family protein n=1 Tax=Xenorhabdus bovienii TaxID=40576 RepID=UPI003DA331F2